MDPHRMIDNPQGSWRYFFGSGLVVCAIAMALVGFMSFPHGGSPLSDEWVNTMHRSALMIDGAFIAIAIGLTLIGYEAWRRHDLRVETSCPIDRKTYLTTLQAMYRQAERNPREPVTAAQLRTLLRLIEPMQVIARAGYHPTQDE